MGTFRLLLAATVMLGHFAAFYPHPLPYLMYGTASVPAFYIVSGFLITLVLHEKYGDRIGLFYSNRALRIFPLYWAALIVFVVVNWLVVQGNLPGLMPTYRGTIALQWANQHGSEIGPTAIAVLTLANIFIVGQDFILFIGKWPHLAGRDYFYHWFMYVGPAWTIAVEFWFYAIAPFIVRRQTGWTIAVLVASLAGRAIAVLLGYKGYTEAYDFPPFEMAFFMAGSLAYRAYARLRKSGSRWVTYYAITSCAVIILLTVFYLKLPLARPVYLFAVAICLPGIVHAARWNPLDGTLGELSYPIYLLHPIFTAFIVPGKTVVAEILAVIGTVTISVGFVKLVEKPIDDFRYRRAIRRPAVADGASAVSNITAARMG